MNPVFLSAVSDTGLTMASVLSTITEVFTAAVGWVGTVAETVANNPLLLVGVVIGFIGTGIGLLSREDTKSSCSSLLSCSRPPKIKDSRSAEVGSGGFG